jgi:glycosyltransferase involved in cell wall biosynthesis
MGSADSGARGEGRQVTHPRPRLLLVNRDRHPWPLDRPRRQKYEALAELVELRVLGAGPEHDDKRFRLFPPRPVVDLGLLPARVARELRRFRPDAVLVQGVHEGVAVLLARRLTRAPAKVILDVQGDWRGAARLYGSRRRAFGRIADLAAPVAVRRADAVRTVSEQTTELVRALDVEPAATFPSYVEMDVFGGPPLPLHPDPSALFVGALERVKGIDVLLEAWPHVGVGTLRLVGDGSLRDQVTVCYEAGELDWTRRLEPEEVARALDEAWCLVLPSRSEGLPRVVLEAFARGRAVVATRVGGIPDVVQDDANGLLVEPEDAAALAEAVARVLGDRDLAERLAAGAAASAGCWRTTPDAWAQRVCGLVARTLNLD